jgi:hypothetical protein
MSLVNFMFALFRYLKALYYWNADWKACFIVAEVLYMSGNMLYVAFVTKRLLLFKGFFSFLTWLIPVLFGFPFGALALDCLIQCLSESGAVSIPHGVTSGTLVLSVTVAAIANPLANCVMSAVIAKRHRVVFGSSKELEKAISRLYLFLCLSCLLSFLGISFYITYLVMDSSMSLPVQVLLAVAPRFIFSCHYVSETFFQKQLTSLLKFKNKHKMEGTNGERRCD